MRVLFELLNDNKVETLLKVRQWVLGFKMKTPRRVFI